MDRNEDYNKLYESFMKKNNHSIKRQCMEARISKYRDERKKLRESFINYCVKHNWNINGNIVYDGEHELEIISK